MATQSADGMGGMGLGQEAMKLGVRDRKTLTISAPMLDAQSERCRQDELRDSGKFDFTCADPGVGANLSPLLMDMLANLSVLGEEVGEACAEANELMQFEHWVHSNLQHNDQGEPFFRSPPKEKWGYITGLATTEDIPFWIAFTRTWYIKRLRTELVQVAAVALGMLERLDLEG